jgi:hypothetical protein
LGRCAAGASARAVDARWSREPDPPDIRTTTTCNRTGYSDRIGFPPREPWGMEMPRRLSNVAGGTGRCGEKHRVFSPCGFEPGAQGFGISETGPGGRERHRSVPDGPTISAASSLLKVRIAKAEDLEGDGRASDRLQNTSLRPGTHLAHRGDPSTRLYSSRPRRRTIERSASSVSDPSGHGEGLGPCVAPAMTHTSR